MIRTEETELTPLSDRLGLLLVVRIFMACTVMASSVVLPSLPLQHNSVIVAEGYAAIAIALHLLHRLLANWTNRRWLILVNVMLLIDGLFVASVLAGSGQSRSAFIFLAYVHIVSVTLLVGFRTGLKMAFWHSILLLTVYYLSLAQMLPTWTYISVGAVDSHKLSNQLSVASASGLWLVAIVTAVFASLNERELRRRKGELTIIADLSTTIEQTRRPSEILQALVDTAVTAMSCNRAVAVCTHGDKILIVGATEGFASFNGETFAAIGGVIGQAAEKAAPVLVRILDPVKDAELAKLLPDAGNVAVVPLVAEGETVAVLVVEWGSRNKRRVTQPMIDLMSNVAGRVALSLSNTFLLAEVQRLASVDGLTSLPNRRTFNQAIEREVERAQRSGLPVSLVMLDIDHFKAVNDNHGHQMGDQVLAESASGVMRACRSEDIPARYGGEEIAVIMPNCSIEQAAAAADRIRSALGSANLTLSGITASAGVATFPDNATDVVSLLSAADEALYASKDTGRDRTTASVRSSSLTTTP